MLLPNTGHDDKHAKENEEESVESGISNYDLLYSQAGVGKERAAW
jgi:hypothetical protein